MSETWIWQQPDWPNFDWDKSLIEPRLRQLRQHLGILIGHSQSNLADQQERTLDTLLGNILASSAIENEILDARSVRSSLANKLGMDSNQPYPVSDRSEGIAQLMLDAIENSHETVTVKRLCTWHHWLFPQTEALLLSRPILVGQLRGSEPMQVVSGRLDKPTVHYEAPPRDILEQQLDSFLHWFQQSLTDPLLDPLLRAAITHLWFVTLHPFDDGNGRITRALTDMALAQADHQSIRLYAMSAAILERRQSYYDILESTQRGDMDITPWLLWFFDTLEQTLDQALESIDRTLNKRRFWMKFHDAGLSPEQIKVLNRLLDGGEKGFEDGISSSQYQKVAKVSKATATRHLADLLSKGCIEKLPGGGRSTRYRVTDSYIS
ncbi:Fic family protein [Oceanobacter mangrovi]|uniref:Fic family protein n=1 Tax=Oceanobacter mangrovi TaxID=2862510 RepID=UPI001C8D300D|nr:Fic family protein [Oceanobacter mangrovi]